MRSLRIYLLPLLLLALVAGLTGACGGSEEAHAQMYHCPMHPDYTSDKPGECPICGMDLVPIEGEGEGTETASDLPEAVQSAVPGLAAVAPKEGELRLAGVQTAAAVRRSLTPTSRAVGVVTADESRVRRVQIRISGWVEKLYVNTTGQPVRAGEALLSIYSPELLATQEEFLRAREAAVRFSDSSLPEVQRGGQDLLTAARRRLELFDVPPSVITRLEKTGEAQRTITLTSPASGYVTGKEVFEGMQVGPGMDLLTVTDLSRVWVEADFYQFESGSVRVGQKATIALPDDPATRLTARASFVYPTLDPMSRTLKVRYELANPGLVLKPGMYVDVMPELGTSEGVVIPDSAIIDTGTRQVVFVESNGSFEPRQVQVGTRANGEALILSGLAEGESVAVRANFLLDSESRLRAAISGSGAGSGSPAPATPPQGHQH